MEEKFDRSTEDILKEELEFVELTEKDKKQAEHEVDLLGLLDNVYDFSDNNKNSQSTDNSNKKIA